MLGSLKEKSPDTKVTTLMTDDGKIIIQCHINNYLYSYTIIIVCNNHYTIMLSDLVDNSGWNAATQVFHNDIEHFYYATGHVHRLYNM